MRISATFSLRLFMRQNEKKARKTQDNEEMPEPYTKMIGRKELIKIKIKTKIQGLGWQR